MTGHPVSALQQSLLAGVLTQPGNFFTIPFVRVYDSLLDRRRLEDALRQIVTRHEVLRTTFHQHGEQWEQSIRAPYTPEIEYADMRREPRRGREAAADAILAKMVDEPFSFDSLPLFRVSLVRLGEERDALTFSVHHLVFDWPSFGLLSRELTMLYNDQAAAKLPELPAQFTDYVDHQQNWLASSASTEAAVFWAEQLRGLPTQPLLSADRPRQAGASCDLAAHRFALDSRLSKPVAQLGSRSRANLFMTYLALFLVLLHQRSGSTDIAVYTVFGDRNRPEFRPLIGMLMNDVVLRVDLSGDPTFLALLAQVRQVTLDAYRHQSLPLDQVRRLVASAAPPATIYRVKFMLYATSPGPVLAQVGQVPYQHGSAPKPHIHSDELWGEDLRLALLHTGTDVAGQIAYNENLFETETVTEMVRQLFQIAGRAVADPSRRLGELLAK